MPDNLVALRDRRQQVISRLSEGYAEDVIDVDELERRLDIAHGTRSLAELDELVADLAPVTASTALVLAGPVAVDDPNRPKAKRLRAIMSAIERRGRWSVPRKLRVRAFWGHVELDFRDASLAPGVTTILVRVFMGNVEIVLPPNLAVDVDVSSFAGAVTERHRLPPDDDPARPVIRIIGSVRFGNLDVSTRLPSETARDAIKRERRERKQLREAAGKALPPGDTR